MLGVRGPGRRRRDFGGRHDGAGGEEGAPEASNGRRRAMSARIVSQDEWTKARLALLAKEKALTRQRDELARERRALPWVKIEKPYVFDGPTGKETLADLFEGRSQLAVYHFMLGPEWEEGCPSCSMLADSVEGMRVHLEQRATTFAAVPGAPRGAVEASQEHL